jgi:class 3 adenylate cyclase
MGVTLGNDLARIRRNRGEYPSPVDEEAPPVGCGACGTVNEAGRKFCKECGGPLSVSCASCSFSNAADSKFCGECGEPLSHATSAVAPAPPSTERRLVSVLFADLVGFTTLSEHRDAEDVRDLLSGYFDAARQVIERHGGLVEKFIGDAVMAVWGTPIAYEDDAERAVRAGLELVAAVAGLGRDMDIDLAARAGVLTGEAATTEGGHAEGIVVGDMVNTASRLQSAAEPGTVLVGDSTHRAASKAIAFSDGGNLSLKGKDEPVHAWRALRVVGERRGSGRASGLEPPFVGRSEELRLVKDLLHATEREGKARLVSVTGIGGIGKSRLSWEFRKYVDGLADDVYWHQGRCPAYGEGVAFWALGEMVRMRTGIAETDDPVASRQKLADAVQRYVPDPDERRWLSPRLAHLLGLQDRPSGERDELFSAWRTFFERIVDLGPVVMVFEDLQWADTGLLDFIESTLEWSRDRPILIVTLARPELFDRRPTWGTNQRSFTAIRLEPLPGDVMTELVRGFVPSLPAGDVERIVERSEGVPLYAVETLRMLADRGVLEPRDDGYAVVSDVGNLEVPETLHALIAARLDGLAAQDRALLQDAAVLGQSFTPRASRRSAEPTPPCCRSASKSSRVRSSWRTKPTRARPNADSTRSSRA